MAWPTSVGVSFNSISNGVTGLVICAFLYTLFYTLIDFVVNHYKLSKYRKCRHAADQDLKGRHVMITGGSSGIGKEVAIAAARRGAHVSLLARNPQKLSDAADEIREKVETANEKRTKLFEMSVDLSAGFETVDKAIQETISKMGPVYMLVNCAGFAISRKFENLSVNEEQQMMNVNYFGSVWTTRAVLPSMKESGDGGVIVFVASQGSLVGVFGYTAYCGSKFAIRGFAESLAMETSPHNISVYVSCPPDTNTPGFEAENVGKPEETRLISEYGGLFSADAVAEQMVLDAVGIAGLGQFSMGTNGLDGWIAVKLCSGFVNSSFATVLLETFILGPARFISWIYTRQFYGIIHKCHKKRNKDKKTA